MRRQGILFLVVTFLGINLHRLEEVAVSLDIGDLILQSNDNEDDVIAFCADGTLPYNEEQEIVL